MKKITMILLFVFAISSTFAQDSAKKTDPKLFGTWSGSEVDGQIKGMTKNWIMHRFEDGTFVLLFTTVKGSKITNFAEKGRWWIDEDGLFNEFHNISELTDIYIYQIIDNNNVKFKAKKVSIEMAADSYEFIDKRVDDGA